MALLFVAIGLGAAKLIHRSRHRKRRPRIPDGRRGRGGPLRPVAVAGGQRRGVAVLQFFFLPPVYTFTITDPNNVAAFFFFMLIARLVSNVAARVRTQAVTAIGRVRTTESLYAFSRKLAGTATLDDVLWATAYQTALMLKVRVVLLLPEDGVHHRKGRLSAGGRTRQGRSRGGELDLVERSAGRARLGYAARRKATVLADADRARAIGVIGIDDDRTGPLLTPDQRRLLDALTHQGALAIERVSGWRIWTGSSARWSRTGCAKRC